MNALERLLQDELNRALAALAGAPGSLRVIDQKTVYFRPPSSFLESARIPLRAWTGPHRSCRGFGACWRAG